MDTTVVTPSPGSGPTIVSSDERGHPYLDALILAEQSAQSRQQSLGDQTLLQSVGQSATATQVSIWANAARVERGFSDTADRIHASNRDIAERLHDMERHYMAQVHGVDLRIAEMEKLHFKTQLKSAKQYADLKSTIIEEASKSREQAADFRIRDLEASLSYLKVKDLHKK